MQRWGMDRADIGIWMLKGRSGGTMLSVFLHTLQLHFILVGRYAGSPTTCSKCSIHWAISTYLWNYFVRHETSPWRQCARLKLGRESLGKFGPCPISWWFPAELRTLSFADRLKTVVLHVILAVSSQFLVIQQVNSSFHKIKGFTTPLSLWSLMLFSKGYRCLFSSLVLGRLILYWTQFACQE